MSVMSITVTKSKGTVSIDAAALPDAVYKEALLLGLKELANRGMSKITSALYPNEDERKAAAQAIAEKNVEDILAGKIRFTGKKAKGASGAVMNEARRLARNVVKDALKQAGKKISHYPASEITKAANALIENDPSYIETATANLEKRTAVPAGIDVTALVAASPELVAKAEAKAAAAKKDKPLSAAKAGKVKPRSKPASATA